MKKLGIFTILVLLTACQQQMQGHLVVFLENEAGVEPYKTRIITTPEYLRLDDGVGSQDYVIFNRKHKVIYNVNTGSRTIMAVEQKQENISPPMELKHTVNDLGLMQGAPKIKGNAPRRYQYVTNGEVCLEVVSVEGILEEVLQGMREFYTVLASDSVTTFAALPADLQHPCDISFSTFAPTRHLQKGFPIQTWKPGYSRALIDYQETFAIEPGMFELPKDYFTYKLKDFREGKVDFYNSQAPAGGEANKTGAQ